MSRCVAVFLPSQKSVTCEAKRWILRLQGGIFRKISVVEASTVGEMRPTWSCRNTLRVEYRDELWTSRQANQFTKRTTLKGYKRDDIYTRLSEIRMRFMNKTAQLWNIVRATPILLISSSNLFTLSMGGGGYIRVDVGATFRPSGTDLRRDAPLLDERT